MPRAAWLWIPLALVGCDAPPEQSAPPPPTAAPYDHDAYCQTICARAARCGAEAAAPLRAGDPAGEAEVRDVTAACVSGCRSETPPAGIDTERAEICLRREDCAALASCLEAL